MTRYFLQDNIDVTLKDPKRFFNDEERFVIWILAEKKCALSEKQMPELSDMKADHYLKQHAHAGATTLKYSRGLCKVFNKREQKNK